MSVRDSAAATQISSKFLTMNTKWDRRTRERSPLRGHCCEKNKNPAHLEYVPEGHGPVGDAMDKHGLQDSLDVVEGVTDASQAAATHVTLAEVGGGEVKTLECSLFVETFR